MKRIFGLILFLLSSLQQAGAQTLSQRIGFNLSEDKIILNFAWIGNPEKTYTLFRQWIKN
jgi:hypothetical protein